MYFTLPIVFRGEGVITCPTIIAPFYHHETYAETLMKKQIKHFASSVHHETSFRPGRPEVQAS